MKLANFLVAGKLVKTIDGKRSEREFSFTVEIQVPDIDPISRFFTTYDSDKVYDQIIETIKEKVFFDEGGKLFMHNIINLSKLL